MHRIIAPFTLFLLFVSFLHPFTVDALDFPSVGFPRLANLYLKSPLTDEEIDRVADWDTVVLAMSVQDTNPEAFARIREKNPDVIILAYVITHSFPWFWLPYIESEDGPWHQIQDHMGDEWWALEDDGDHVVFWPGQYTIDPTNYASKIDGERWNTYLPRFLEEEVMSTGYWDGIFFDNIWETASWVNDGNFDFDRDGKIDDAAEIDRAWKEGMTIILRESRERLGDDAILISNGGNGYMDYLNGRMFESFPNIWEGEWKGSMPNYFDLSKNAQEHQLIIVNGDTLNTGDYTDWQDMRFALTSTLLDDGFFSYDWGTEDHTQFWWYDEYDAALGKPINTARNVLTNSATVQAGVWRRDFEKGVVFVNSTSSSQKVVLEGGFERVNGVQDRSVNSGELTTSVTIPANDGIILLRRLSVLYDTPFVNGTFANVVNRWGSEIRQGFYAYTPFAEGGRLTEITDLEGNSSREILMSAGNRIQIKNENGTLRKEFYPYGNVFTGNVLFDAGDLDGDGHQEIVTGTGQRGGTQVRIFNADGTLKNAGFFAYAKQIRTGVRIAVGDVNGDGKDEIVTGPGEGGGPHIRVFDGNGKPVVLGFFAYDPRIRIGVNMAVGDVDHDGQAEIVTGAGPGGGPHVRIFNRFGTLENPGFFAYDKSSRRGMRVAIQDVDDDGFEEILTFDGSIEF
ncbi:MAG: VCBS repeat-containing protein [Candidatus Kerfeldbacteria bacterium]|nr:VCBS repeat-containing protein [Candidatus Kerfeldbacteria bacterium]